MKWTERAFELLQAGDLHAEVITKAGGKVVRVNGTCPYCQDELRYSESLIAVTEGSERAIGGGTDLAVAEAATEPRYEEFIATCGCSESHDGDPNKGTGCGTSFRVAVLASDD